MREEKKGHSRGFHRRSAGRAGKGDGWMGHVRLQNRATRRVGSVPREAGGVCGAVKVETARSKWGHGSALRGPPAAIPTATGSHAYTGQMRVFGAVVWV